MSSSAKYFVLDRAGISYTISINGIILVKDQQFRKEWMALEWANSYISTWINSHLNVNFQQNQTLRQLTLSCKK